MTEKALSREEQWEELYHKFSDTLQGFGKTSLSTETDLWLIDDDYGGHHHKIEVINTQAWSDEAQNAVGKILAEFYPNWGVYVVFADGSDRDGFIVYADGVETTPRWL